MNFVSVIAGMLITFLVVMKSFTVKIGTKHYSSRQIAFANVAFLVVITLFTLPFMHNLLEPLYNIHWSLFIPLCASGFKAVLLYYSLKYIAELAKESNSSSVFAGYISLGIGALVNSFLLADSLSAVQLFSCVVLSILGAVFFFRGPASDLSTFGKRVFILLTLVIVAIMVVDKVAISGLNWYVHLIVSTWLSFVLSLYFLLRERKFHYFKDLAKPVIASIGIVFSVGEFVILYSMQYLLPVSIVFLFIRLSAPIVMFISAYLYKERTPKEQFIFGLLAFCFAVPLFLFK